MGDKSSMNNSYEGVLDFWKVQLIVRRAKRYGFRGATMDDALQECVLALQTFKYDAAESNGASEQTALVSWIDNVLLKLYRAEIRAKRRYDEMAKRRCTEVPATNHYLSVDVQNAIETLDDFEQKVCELLRQGVEKRHFRELLHCDQTRIWEAILNIRQRFVELGLKEWLYEA